jgi:hypothetical protein
VNRDEERDFSQFMMLPSMEQEHDCYEAFYDATSNESICFKVCPICAREWLKREGEETSILSDPSIVALLTTVKDDVVERNRNLVMHELLEVDEDVVSCWMCFECLRALEREKMPRLALANNLWIGDIPNELMVLTIPEQLLISRHYPRCYIFKLFPRDINSHIPLDNLYSGMAGNASLFELNMQEVVEMLKGQQMPSPVKTLVTVIAITFVGTKRLPADWLKKTFRVRRRVVFDALKWLQNHNPIYADIKIDDGRLNDLPQDGVPDELLTVV